MRRASAITNVDDCRKDRRVISGVHIEEMAQVMELRRRLSSHGYFQQSSVTALKQPTIAAKFEVARSAKTTVNELKACLNP